MLIPLQVSTFTPGRHFQPVYIACYVCPNKVFEVPPHYLHQVLYLGHQYNTLSSQQNQKFGMDILQYPVMSNSHSSHLYAVLVSALIFDCLKECGKRDLKHCIPWSPKCLGTFNLSEHPLPTILSLIVLSTKHFIH